MSDGPDIVLVGYRPGALHAASRLGLRVLLVEETPPTEAARRRIVASVQAPLEGGEVTLVRLVRASLDGGVPRAVVSVGERGVLAAASLRAAFALGGIGPATARLARDKPSMKAAARAAGIPCADWRELDQASNATDLASDLGLPLVFKRRDASGTRGLRVAHSVEEGGRALTSIPEAARSAWMAERFVRGVEMSVESFVSEGEILFVNPTEYYVPAFANIAPASLPDDELQAVFALNAAVIGALGLRRGMTHLELFRTPQGPVFGEVAVRPPGGRIMRLLRRAYDFDPWETVIRLELGDRNPPLHREASRAAGVWMLHPPAGTVRSARGFAAASRVKGVRKLVCRLRAGVRVPERLSTGSDLGWMEVWGRDRDEVRERMQRAHDLIRIEMEP